MKQRMNQMNTPETNHRYQTSDLNLASFPRRRNFSIVDIKRQSGKTMFAFANNDELRTAILIAPTTEKSRFALSAIR